MNDITDTLTDYREQVSRWTQVLVGRDPTPDLAGLPETTLRQMQVFAQENRDKRLQKLSLQLALVAQAFDDIDELLQDFIAEVPQPAYAGFAEDAEGFLDWLVRERPMTPEQADHIACQRARHAVEALGRRKRREHLRFQELLSVADELSLQLTDNQSMMIHLNPCRIWSRFQTQALLDDQATVPANVVFFAQGNDIRTAVLEPGGCELVRELESLAPCSLATWAAQTQNADLDELANFCQDLTRTGLLACS